MEIMFLFKLNLKKYEHPGVLNYATSTIYLILSL